MDSDRSFQPPNREAVEAMLGSLCAAFLGASDGQRSTLYRAMTDEYGRQVANVVISRVLRSWGFDSGNPQTLMYLQRWKCLPTNNTPEEP